MPPVLVTFTGGEEGQWQVTGVKTVKGDQQLALTPSVAVTESAPKCPPASADEQNGWTLRGVISNLRYTTKEELKSMVDAGNPPLNRPHATLAALIPINKSEAWWGLTQEERTAIIAESHHIDIGREYLPAVARRLHHGRDLGEPFDFLTWFEYSPEDEGRFDEMLRRLRETKEWSYVTDEVEVRLERRQ